jgi:hypothetical protein
MLARAFPPPDSDIGAAPIGGLNDLIGKTVEPAIRTYDPGVAVVTALICVMFVVLVLVAWRWPETVETGST